ncbi:MAG: hypothetical protein WAN23_04915 [Candidatus Acidiferrales bacterium]
MPYEVELGPQSAHCITLADIERAVVGDAHAQDFIREYGNLDRARWRDLLVEFREDPWGDGRAILVPKSGNYASHANGNGHRRNGHERQLAHAWEAHLARFGLDSKTLNGRAERQDVIIPTNATPPLKNCREDVQLAERYGIRWNTGHAVPIAVHERAVPDGWIYSDVMVREFLAHRFPGAFAPPSKRGSERRDIQRRARRRAAQLCAVLYMAFRLMLPYETIGMELKIDPDRALRVASDGRAHGDLYFSGKKCCRNRRRVIV